MYEERYLLFYFGVTGVTQYFRLNTQFLSSFETASTNKVVNSSLLKLLRGGNLTRKVASESSEIRIANFRVHIEMTL